KLSEIAGNERARSLRGAKTEARRRNRKQLCGGFRSLCVYRMPQVGTCYSLDLGYRVKGQMDCFVSLAYCVFIRSGHEAKCLALLEVDVSGMGADAELRSGFLERIELREKFRLCQLPLRKAALGLVVRVDEVLHVILLVKAISCICTTTF